MGKETTQDHFSERKSLPASQSLEAQAPKAASQRNDIRQNPQDGGNAIPKQKAEFLNDSTVNIKEQRKADWAIMKEMAKYLWPKVGEEKSPGTRGVHTYKRSHRTI